METAPFSKYCTHVTGVLGLFPWEVAAHSSGANFELSCRVGTVTVRQEFVGQSLVSESTCKKAWNLAKTEFFQQVFILTSTPEKTGLGNNMEGLRLQAFLAYSWGSRVSRAAFQKLREHCLSLQNNTLQQPQL